MDELSSEANESQSVNTIYFQSGKVIGHNTDISGFELGIKYSKYDVKTKIVFILGAGGVVSSIIIALKKMGAAKIIISNRTKTKAEDLKKIFNELEIIDWGKTPNFDMIINATSIGLKNEEGINLDYTSVGNNKFFYDLIYNPKETIFLKRAKLFGNKAENGKMMFIYQAHQAFTVWHKLMPDINEETMNLID
jgi:shikimate dehydrogenase